MYKKAVINDEIIKRKRSKFLRAAKGGWLKVVQNLLLDPITITPQTSLEALEIAVVYGHLEIVKELLKIDKVVDAIGYYESAVLFNQAIRNYRLNIAKELLQIETVKRGLIWRVYRHKIVSMTIKHGQSEIIRELATASSSYNAHEILKVVIRCGHLGLAKELLQIEAIKTGIDLGFRCREIVSTAIEQRGWSEIIRELAAANSFYNARGYRCREIIETAIESGRPEVVRELLQIDIVKGLVAANDSLNEEVARLIELETAIKLGYSENVIAFLRENSPKIAIQGNYFLAVATESEQAEVLEALLLSNVIATHQIIARDHFLLKKAVEKGCPGTIFALMKFYKSHFIKLPTNISISIKRSAESRSAMTVAKFYTDYSLSVNRNLSQYFPTVLTQMIATYCDISPNAPKPLTPLFNRPSNQTGSRNLSLTPPKSTKPQPAQFKPKQATTGSKQSAPEAATWFLSLSWTRAAGDPNKMRSNKMPLKKAEKFKEFLKKANENPYHFTRVASGSGTFQFEVSKKVLSESLKRLKTSETGTVPKRYVRK